MKMRQNRTVTALIIVMVLCAVVQMAQEIHRARFQVRWQRLFDRVSEIQADIHRLEAKGAEADQLLSKREALFTTVAEIRESYHPDLVPTWLHAVTTIVLLAGVVYLWSIGTKTTEQRAA
jgi:hypothetical protein